MAKLTEVIVASELIGRGTPDDPFTRVSRFYEPKTGDLLGESRDPRGAVGLACVLDELATELSTGTSFEQGVSAKIKAAVAAIRGLRG
jgi:hypothetical protein